MTLRDVDLLERLMVFAMDNLGQVVSARSASAFMKSQRRSLRAETIYNYLTALAQACLVFKVRRFDIKGKRNLETLEKYFLADHGFAHAWLGFRPDEVPGILENIVYLTSGFSQSRRRCEVYLTGPRRSAPDKLCTIIRHPVFDRS